MLARMLANSLESWNGVRETVLDLDATWRWAYSDSTGRWNYRAYQEGDRFLVALTPAEGTFEVSLNLRASELDTVEAGTPAEELALGRLREGLSGQADGWVHVPVASSAELPLVLRLLATRARRVQKPRSRGSRQRTR
jgi:hypothetical protein